MPYSLEGRPKGLLEAAFTEKEYLYYMPSSVNLSKACWSRIWSARTQPLDVSGM